MKKFAILVFIFFILGTSMCLCFGTNNFFIANAAETDPEYIEVTDTLSLHEAVSNPEIPEVWVKVMNNISLTGIIQINKNIVHLNLNGKKIYGVKADVENKINGMTAFEIYNNATLDIFGVGTIYGGVGDFDLGNSASILGGCAVEIIKGTLNITNVELDARHYLGGNAAIFIGLGNYAKVNFNSGTLFGSAVGINATGILVDGGELELNITSNDCRVYADSLLQSYNANIKMTGVRRVNGYTQSIFTKDSTVELVDCILDPTYSGYTIFTDCKLTFTNCQFGTSLLLELNDCDTKLINTNCIGGIKLNGGYLDIKNNKMLTTAYISCINSIIVDGGELNIHYAKIRKDTQTGIVQIFDKDGNPLDLQDFITGDGQIVYDNYYAYVKIPNSSAVEIISLSDDIFIDDLERPILTANATANGTTTYEWHSEDGTLLANTKDFRIPAATAFGERKFYCILKNQEEHAVNPSSVQSRLIKVTVIPVARNVIDAIEKLRGFDNPLNNAQKLLITKARTLFNNISADEQVKVSNYQILLDAESLLDTGKLQGKTFFEKYWAVIAVTGLLIVTGLITIAYKRTKNKNKI